LAAALPWAISDPERLEHQFAIHRARPTSAVVGGDRMLSLIAFSNGGTIVANLIVRDIDESLVRALKQRAARHGRSAEAEHREILASVLGGPRKRHLAEVLAAVPSVGRDEDFARIEDAAEAQRVPG